MTDPGRACPAAARWWRFWKIANQRKTAKSSKSRCSWHPRHFAPWAKNKRNVFRVLPLFSTIPLPLRMRRMSFNISDELLTQIANAFGEWNCQMASTIWQIVFRDVRLIASIVMDNLILLCTSDAIKCANFSGIRNYLPRPILLLFIFVRYGTRMFVFQMSLGSCGWWCFWGLVIW